MSCEEAGGEFKVWVAWGEALTVEEAYERMFEDLTTIAGSFHELCTLAPICTSNSMVCCFARYGVVI